VTKTTVYLPDDLKQAVARLAATSGKSEAELIRQAIGALVSAADRPRPRGALFASGDSTLSERVDEASGFGERYPPCSAATPAS
jgi:hypothetical protein